MPNVPPGPCGHPGCHHLRPCPDHKKGSWAGSTSRPKRLTGRNLQTRNARIMRRDRTICHVCGEPASDQIDHVIPLAEDGPDTDDNLAPIHSTPCHERKSEAERLRGLARRRAQGGHRGTTAAEPSGNPRWAADVVAPTRREIENPALERPKRARSGVWGSQR